MQLRTFRHYKGGTYTLLGVGRLSEDRKVEAVIYVSHLTEEVWIRPRRMWVELVEWPDGVKRARFEPEYPEAPWNQFRDFFPPQEPESWTRSSPPPKPGP